MKKLRFAGIAVVLVIMAGSMLSLGGCVKKDVVDEESGFTIDPSVSKYHAVTYDRAISWLNDDFREENITKMATMQDNPDPAPYDITLVIKEQSAFDNAFAEFSVEVDFEREMLVLYFFTDFNYSRPIYVTNVQLSGRLLDITLTHLMAPLGPNGKPPKDASKPTHRCIVVQMDRVDVAVVNIKREFKRE